MVTLAQRIEQLRTQAGLGRPALAAALGFPKGAIEKFETGRQTPTKEQQEKMAAYFGVSLFYLRGESSDPTRQDDWMTMSPADLGDDLPSAPRPAPKRPKGEEPQQGTVLDALLAGKTMQQQLRQAVLDVLRSPEGQEILAKAIAKALAGQK
jgi:transcriptional regulator with XRE-family HTH domain